MPAYFVNMPDASMALVRALVALRRTPKSYEQIFPSVDRRRSWS